MLNIEEIKKLEDLKEKLRSSINEVKSKSVDINYVFDGVNQFKSFFSKLDFTIVENLGNDKDNSRITHKRIIATYKRFKVILLVPIDNIDKVWRLCIGYNENSYNEWYRILINNINDYNISINSEDCINKQNVDDEIKQKQSELEILNNMLKSNYNCLFQLRNKQNEVVYDKCKNFLELLEKVFEYTM
ncbi:hypothetical protein CBC_A0559 [Clostridium botulinum C str. Eklund]|nr:hypothetical protein CBC_A0559 [Clostridium botulinum C str. Eklund]NEZ49564.1 hypothetical protein [Clostridium botulinum]